MRTVFVNLKRWEVPRSAGGVCPEADPAAWMRGVIAQSVALGLSCLTRFSGEIGFSVPELQQIVEKYLAGSPGR